MGCLLIDVSMIHIDTYVSSIGIALATLPNVSCIDINIAHLYQLSEKLILDSLNINTHILYDTELLTCIGTGTTMYSFRQVFGNSYTF